MTPENERIVRETWRKLEPVSDAMVDAFYHRLFESNPAAHDLFASTDMVEQRRKFRGMLVEIVNAIDEPYALVHQVAASGKRHVEYGVVERDYDDVGAALLWAISQALADEFTPEVQAAWREAYALVAAVMKRAASSHH